jgi:hypothetical protein
MMLNHLNGHKCSQYLIYCRIGKSLLILLLLPLFSNGQNNTLGSWNILNIKYGYNKQLSFFAEGQLRSLRLYDHFHYFEYKGGINYKVHPSVNLTLGAGSYQTYRAGGNFELPQNNDEFRLWPQLTLSQDIGSFKVEQRYRTELRWTSNGYRNRFRYRVGLLYPFGQKVKGYKPYQVSVSNELFFTDRSPYFERNRIQVALNVKPSFATTVQLGYLHQFDYKINDETGTDFLVVGFCYEIFRKKTTQPAIQPELKDN